MAETSLTEEAVVRWLRGLSDGGFFKLVYKAAEGRFPDAHDASWLEAHFVAGIASREKDAEEERWDVTLVGLSSDNSVVDDIISQAGEHCGHAVASWAKAFSCPVCGQRTHGS